MSNEENVQDNNTLVVIGVLSHVTLQLSGVPA